MKYLFSLIKGILAGIAIGFGGFLFILMTFLLPNELGKILGALLFPIGLSIVCIFKLFLFTGKIGMIFEQKQAKEFYINLPIMYVGNILGSLSIGYLFFAIFRNVDLFDRAVQVANSKVAFTDYEFVLNMIVKSLITGLCVYLGVKSFLVFKNKVIGVFLIFVFIALFVYIGGDHCVANMYYFSFANKWDNGYTYLNILIATICNSLGTIPGVLLFRLFKTK